MKTQESITPKEYNVIAPLIMGSGVGDGKHTACLVAQAATIDALRNGQTLDAATDRLECACPLLRRLAISLNDANWWKSDAERTEHLRPLIPLLLDSRGSIELIKRRAARHANAVIHELTPLRLEWIAENTESKEYAADIRRDIKTISGIKPITDGASARKARDDLWGLKSSASAYVYAYASAYAYAYASADASADASASAYAYADADAYADAYAYAYADAQKLKYRTAAIDLFKELAAMEEDDK